MRSLNGEKRQFKNAEVDTREAALRKLSAKPKEVGK